MERWAVLTVSLLLFLPSSGAGESNKGKRQKIQSLSSRAEVLEKKWEWEAAIQNLSDALALEKSNASFWHRRGRLYLEHGKTSEALSDFYKATTLKPGFAEALFDRGRAYELTGDDGFAREDYRTACRLGLKKACSAAKKPKVSPEPEKAGPQTAAPTAPSSAPTASVDFKACRSGLSSCVDAGESFGSCVARAKPCEKEQKKGCCPGACIQLFNSLANTQSEAQAFRETFRPASPCVPK